MSDRSPEIDCSHDGIDQCDEARYVCSCGTILEFHYNFIPDGTEKIPDDGEWEEVGHVSDRKV